MSTGERFGRLVVVTAAEPLRDKRGKKIPMIVCRCDCGTVKTFHERNVRRGLSTSCGCLTIERARRARRAQRTPNISYYTAHQRVYRDRGPARRHRCRCGKRAAQWAYMHTDPDELINSAGLRYSPKPEHYAPLCIPCHVELDRAFREAAS